MTRKITIDREIEPFGGDACDELVGWIYVREEDGTYVQAFLAEPDPSLDIVKLHTNARADEMAKFLDRLGFMVTVTELKISV